MLHMTAIPHCFNTPAKWIESYRRPWYSLRSAYPSKAEIEDGIPIWEAKVGLNRYLQLDYKVQARSETLRLKFEFNPSRLKKEGKSPLLVTPNEAFLPQGSLINTERSACPETAPAPAALSNF